MAHPAREGTAVYFLSFSMPFSAIVPEIPDSTPREHEQWLSSELPQGRARRTVAGLKPAFSRAVLALPLIRSFHSHSACLFWSVRQGTCSWMVQFVLPKWDVLFLSVSFFLFSPPSPPLHPLWPFKPSARLMQDSGMKPTPFGSFVQSYFIRTTDSSQWKLFHKNVLLSSRQKCCRSRLLMFLNMFTSINVLCYTSSPISHGRLIYNTPVFPHPGAVLCQLYSYQFCGWSVLWAHFLQDKK